MKYKKFVVTVIGISSVGIFGIIFGLLKIPFEFFFKTVDAIVIIVISFVSGQALTDVFTKGKTATIPPENQHDTKEE